MIATLKRMRRIAQQRTDDESGVALLTAILFMILMAALSTVLVSVVLGQLYPTSLAQKGTKTVYAAQAGMQTALGLIRSATDGGGVGDPTELPCSVSGHVNGTTSDGLNYAAQITYFLADPTGQDPSWQLSNKLTCRANAGTFSTSSPVASIAPRYALIVSQGSAPTIPGASSATVGNRGLSVVYTFSVTNVNVPGGRVYDSNRGYCLRAVSAAAGSLVQFLPAKSCTNDSLELWIYDDDYEIKLASTTAGGKAGLCITGPVKSGDAAQNVKLQTCATDGTRWNQLWSWTGANSWQGQNQDIASGNSGYCLGTGYQAGTALDNRYLQVANGCNGAMAPTAQIGAGAASYKTQQLVNYKEFGRCADVTLEQIGYDYMISYPCKQDASGKNQLYWNHKWMYTEPTAPATSRTTTISVAGNGDGRTYCLTTPGKNSGNYPDFSVCSAGSAQQTWTRVYDTKSYASSYIFTDTYGRCLSVDSTDLYNGLYSKIVIDDCDGTDAQKWNAPPIYAGATITGYREVTP